MTRLHICRLTVMYDPSSQALLEQDWMNVLFTRLPRRPTRTWIACDVRAGLPFPDHAFEMAYVSHIVEHLSFSEARTFASELRRVVEPGGLVRVTTPDLETVARRYLERLDEAARAGTAQALRRHRWATIILIDQLVRERSGGLLLEALRAPDADELRAQASEVLGVWGPDAPTPPREVPRGFRELAYAVVRRIRRARLGGDPRRTLEAHRSMWDRIALAGLLAEAGFTECEQTAYDRSRLPGWERYDFDRSSGEYQIEPSIYVEARNPVSSAGPAAGADDA
jgi:hypothetical protein